jgi:nicotinic acid mononucleotide adenylyltransferase
MKTQPQHKQQQTNMINTPRPNNNKSYNDNDNKSKFVRTRNQNKDIPVSASKIRKRIRDVKRTLTKVSRELAVYVASWLLMCVLNRVKRVAKSQLKLLPSQRDVYVL